MAVGYVDDTVRLTVTFRSFSNPNDQGSLDDPDTVVVNLYTDEATPSLVFTANPTRLSYAVYQYDWIPSQEGLFTLQFEGTFSDASVDIVQEKFTIIEVGDTAESGEVLGEDYLILFSGTLSPLCVDPDELSPFFPDATPYEIAEAIQVASTDVQFLLKLAPGECSSDPAAYEYIKAAAACALSKIFGGGGMQGPDGDTTRIQLGDLEVQKGGGGSFGTNRGTLTPENALTWCELAGVLRKELMYRSVGFKAVVKGSNYYNPIPRRQFRPNAGDWPIRHRQGDLDDPPHNKNWQG